jgi:hypothetical protein
MAYYLGSFGWGFDAAPLHREPVPLDLDAFLD